MTFMQGLPRYTVTYCQYGDHRMKPTDIWTNHPDPRFRPPCKNGAKCHEPSPRGTNLRRLKRDGFDVTFAGGVTYTDKNAKERSIIPEQLCNHIVDICEGNLPEEGQIQWRFNFMGKEVM